MSRFVSWAKEQSNNFWGLSGSGFNIHRCGSSFSVRGGGLKFDNFFLL